MSLKVRVLDTQSQQVLFECPLEQSERAYEAAAGFEAMGLDVKIEHPNVNQTLADSLGVRGPQLDEFAESLDEEIDEHPGSCCFDDGKKNLH